jgi:LCP family protein required for cell wall assembly
VKAAKAAVLSFIWPGLGQAYLGRRTIAWMLGGPPLLLLLVIVALGLTTSPLVIAVHLLNPPLAILATLFVLVLGLVRVFSIFEAAEPGDRRSSILAVALVVLVAITHAWLADSTWAFYRAGQAIHEEFASGEQPGQPGQPDPSLDPDAPTTDPLATPDPNATPSPRPSVLPGVNSRVTVLLVGVDNTPVIEHGLTDTLFVASLEPVTDSLTMVSLPRDVGRLPLYSGGTYLPRVNTLMQSADRHPEDYPDGAMGTLVKEMSYLVGIPIDYYARIDIAGFRSLVDAVGGVDVVVETAVHDPGYGFSPTEIGFDLEPGPHHLDGKYATAYARSRHGSSDYDRARRQQQILLALRNRLYDPTVLARLPEIVDAVSSIVRTDAPLDRLPEILQIALSTDQAATRQIVLGPPKYAHGADGATGGLNQLDMLAVEQLSIELFGPDSLYAVASAARPTATPTMSSPQPTLTSTPSRTPRPSPTRTPRRTPSTDPTQSAKPTRTPRASPTPTSSSSPSPPPPVRTPRPSPTPRSGPEPSGGPECPPAATVRFDCGGPIE